MCRNMHVLYMCSPFVARVVIQPQALHCTSVLSADRRRMSGLNAPASTMLALLSSGEGGGGERGGGERGEGGRGEGGG